MKFLRFWFPVVLYSGIIFYVSSIPNLKPPISVVWGDKVFHIIEYIPFGFLVARAFVNTIDELTWGKAWFLVISIAFLYGVSDEIHQIFVIGREVSLVDIIADSIGGFLGGWIYYKSLNLNLNKIIRRS